MPDPLHPDVVTLAKAVQAALTAGPGRAMYVAGALEYLIEVPTADTLQSTLDTLNQLAGTKRAP